MELNFRIITFFIGLFVINSGFSQEVYTKISEDNHRKAYDNIIYDDKLQNVDVNYQSRLGKIYTGEIGKKELKPTSDLRIATQTDGYFSGTNITISGGYHIVLAGGSFISDRTSRYISDYDDNSVTDKGHIFYNTYNNIVLKIASTGNIGVGLGGSDAVSKFQIHHTTKNQHLILSGTNPSLRLSQLADGTDAGGLGLVTDANDLIGGSLTNDIVLKNTSTSANLLFVTNGAERVRITSAGNVGIGHNSTSSLKDKLHLKGGILRIEGSDPVPATNPTGSFLRLGSNANSYSWIQSGTGAKLYLNPKGTDPVLINYDPTLATPPTLPSGYALYVVGNVICEQLRVQLRGNWSDYVFDKDYKLRSLDSVEAFITENKHLPEVPSAKEIENEGINTGEMDAILLKKIEELTLYMIEQKNALSEQKKEIDLLKMKNEELENKLK